MIDYKKRIISLIALMLLLSLPAISQGITFLGGISLDLTYEQFCK
jgi:hypothetical protein